MGIYGSHGANGVMTLSSHNISPMELRNYSRDIFLVSIYCWNVHTQQLTEHLHWLFDLLSKNYYTKKGQVKAAKSPFPYQNSKIKVIYSYGKF